MKTKPANPSLAAHQEQIEELYLRSENPELVQQDLRKAKNRLKGKAKFAFRNTHYDHAEKALVSRSQPLKLVWSINEDQAKVEIVIAQV